MEACNEPPTSLSNKFAFLNPYDEQFEKLQNLLSQKLDDGQGEWFLELGVGDGQSPGLAAAELEQSVATLERISKQLNVILIHLRDRTVSGPTCTGTLPVDTANELQSNPSPSHSPHSSQPSPRVDTGKATADKCIPRTRRKQLSTSQLSPDQSHCPRLSSSSPGNSDHSPSAVHTTLVVREYLLRKDIPSDDFVDVRVAVVGNVDAGKSTLLGVLTHGELDNGRGQARLRLLRHKHEAESGRTSSVNNDILGFDAGGLVVNKPVHGQLDWSIICKASAKVTAIHSKIFPWYLFSISPDWFIFNWSSESVRGLYGNQMINAISARLRGAASDCPPRSILPECITQEACSRLLRESISGFTVWGRACWHADLRSNPMVDDGFCFLGLLSCDAHNSREDLCKSPKIGWIGNLNC